MKRIISILAMAISVVVIASCGGGNAKKEAKQTDPVVKATVEAYQTALEKMNKEGLTNGDVRVIYTELVNTLTETAKANQAKLQENENAYLNTVVADAEYVKAFDEWGKRWAKSDMSVYYPNADFAAIVANPDELVNRLNEK